MPVFWLLFEKRERLWRVSTVPILLLQGVRVLTGYLRLTFQKLSLVGLLAFLAGFCSDPAALLRDNLSINCY